MNPIFLIFSSLQNAFVFYIAAEKDAQSSVSVCSQSDTSEVIKVEF